MRLTPDLHMSMTKISFASWCLVVTEIYYHGLENLCISHLILKGLRMVARALWRSEARRSRRRVQGRSQGTTLSDSDLYNARATILNPFYNMEYKIITKIRQNTAWIEADILGTNLTPNRYNALAPAIVYVSDDVTIPFNSVTSQ